MSVGILGKKVGMTRIFGSAGKEIPVSVIQAGPCKITQIRTPEVDKYSAVQIGFDEKLEKRTKKPILGHLKKSGSTPVRWMREFRVNGEVLSQYQLGQEIKVDIFKEGDVVEIIGTTKGRGFQGVVKRHGFKGLNATHGAKEYFRRPGSIGTNTLGSNTKRGKKLPGHYGDARCTLLNLEVVKVDLQENLILVKGGIPGSRGSLVIIRKSQRG